MKLRLPTSAILLLALTLQSCTTEVWVDDVVTGPTPWQTRQLLESHELWYVDIHATQGPGEVPFLQTAFTLTFGQGTLLANNNLVGIGKSGDGLGVPIGTYAPLDGAVEIYHALDGLWALEVFPAGSHGLELYDPHTGTSYFLQGYSRAGFNYDQLFYDNINFFLQEYSAWEKTFASEAGALNDFDAEQFLQFLAGGASDTFRSSLDVPGTPLPSLQWDYEGIYTVYDVPGDPELKTLTLDYDFMGNDYFELYVLDDGNIELYHPVSGTVYRFSGRGYRQFLKEGEAPVRKRIRRDLPEMKVQRQRPKT